MSMIEESYVSHLLDECGAYSVRAERQAKEALQRRLDEINQLLIRNIRQTFATLSLDVTVRFAQLAVQTPQKFAYAQNIITLFFQRVSHPSQFYIRALLVRAKVLTYRGNIQSEKGQSMMTTLKQAMGYIVKALDLISGPPVDPKNKDIKADGKAKYAFLVYNASTCLYKITRFMLRQGWQRNFTDIYQRIFRLFQELDEPDYNWRARFALILFQCLYDSDRKADAFKVLDALWERTKTKPCDFQDALFKLRVHLSKQNPAMAAVIKKDIEGQDPFGWKILQALQRMRAGGVPEAQIQKELMTIVNQISLKVMSNGETTNTVLSPLMQERLAEAGRIALKYGIVSIGSAIAAFLGKTRQPSQKALILNQYNKAQLLIKKRGQFVDKKTGMVMSAQQIKQLEVDNRKQALKILQKVLNINKKLDNAELIYEGAVLVWNTCLPFLTPQYQDVATKVLQTAAGLLEQIDSIDHDLRTKIHLQLAMVYFPHQRTFAEAQVHTLRGLRLDPSLPASKLLHKFDSHQDPSLYYRPYQRYLDDFHHKIQLKTMRIRNQSDLDLVTLDLWNAAEQKSQTTKMDILQKCLRTLLTSEEVEMRDEDVSLVAEEQSQRRLQAQRLLTVRQKRKKMLAGEVAELAFEWEMNEFSKKACEFVLSDVWEVKNAAQLISVQVKCCYFLAQIKIDELTQDNYQIILQDPVRLNGQGLQSEDKLKEVAKKKTQILMYFKKGLEFALSIQQYYLVFNGAIYMWNNFLSVLRSPNNDSKLKTQLLPLLRDFFEAMKTSLKQMETRSIVYYDLDAKIQIFANIGMVYARLLQATKQTEMVAKICDDLLSTSLAPNTSKLINGIKARISTQKAPVKVDPKKGGAIPTKTNSSDAFIFEIVSQLQAIQNLATANERQIAIVKCFDNLQAWKPKQNDEVQLELHAELWVKVSRLALNEEGNKMMKLGMRCADQALSLLRNDGSLVPSNRLRWYSLAQFLFAQALVKLVNPHTQQTSSMQSLLFAAIDRAVESAIKGHRCSIAALVIDAAKFIWNVCVKLQNSEKNRGRLLHPLQSILNFLKEFKEEAEPDLILLLAQKYFKAAQEAGEYVAGEQIADSLLSLVPKSLQKSLWEAKMVFMSKQGKNQLQAMSSMKEAQPSLQAKLWVKLARMAVVPGKQQSAYHKAIDLLRKQNSIQVVEVLIEYAEWQHRVGNQSLEKVIDTLLTAADQLIEIECSDSDENGEEDVGTVFSRSTRGKKSLVSHSLKSQESKTKKAINLKGATSSKSKVSGVSRLSRVGKATKTIKSKNAKSIFSQREQQPNPDSLNGLHYERLFRIHTLLALFSSDARSRIQYALDARLFLIRLLQLSITTSNEIQQNATKFSEKEQNFTSKLKMPTSVPQWLSFEFPKQFIQRIAKLQHYNFMGTYLFDKPNLTYVYISHLIKIFTSYGLTLHTIPLHFFAHYIAAYILSSDQLVSLSLLRQRLSLFGINHPLQQKVKISFETMSLRGVEQKQELERSKAVQRNEDQMSMSAVVPPNLAKLPSKYECWQEVGSILCSAGQIYTGKAYLTAAYDNAVILSDIQVQGQTHIALALVSYLEGEYKMQHAISATKCCKSSRSWQSLIVVIVKMLIHCHKIQDLRRFISKVQTVINNSLENKNDARESWHADVFQIRNILITIDIANIYVAYALMEAEPTEVEHTIMLVDCISALRKRMQDTLLTISHYQLLCEYLQKIFDYFECGGKHSQTRDLQIFKEFYSLLLQVEQSAGSVLKYAVIHHSEDYHLTVISLKHREVRFLLVKYLCISHQLNIPPTHQYNPDLPAEDQLLQRYLLQLTREVEKKNQPIPLNLSALETAAVILENIKNNIPLQSYARGRWLADQAYVLSLLAENELRVLWSEAEVGESEGAVLSMQAVGQFQTEGYAKLQSFSQCIKCFECVQRGCIAVLQNRGSAIAGGSFQYLCKLQHAVVSITVVDMLRRKMSGGNRMGAAMRLQEEVGRKSVEKMLQKNKLFHSVTVFPSFKECTAMMPRNAAYVVLQFNKSRTQLYFSCMINDGEEEQRTIIARKRQISGYQLKAYLNLIDKIKKCRMEMAKTPFGDDAKLMETVLYHEKILQEGMEKLKELSMWWVEPLLSLFNKVKVVQVDTNIKKAGKDQKKKGGKDEVNSYQSPLPATPSGLQSIVFLLDQFLYALPLEQLSAFDNVPALSRDTSIFYFTRKLQEMSFQPQANNSTGFGQEKGKYFSYDFKDPEVSFKRVVGDIVRETPGIKFEGIDSSVKFPSLADYSRCFSESGFVQVYGALDWLNHIKLNTLAEYVGGVRARLCIVFDQLNLRKPILNKFSDLDGTNEAVAFEDEEFALVNMFNLMNVSVVKNRWTTDWSSVVGRIKAMYRQLGNGLYLGAAVKSNRVDEKMLMNRCMVYVNGPAILRM